jgi:hypothetical protein
MVHLGRLDMARSVRDGNASDVGEIWAGQGSVWKRYGWAFNCGGKMLALSVCLLGLAHGVMLKLGS